ncbi:MAG: vitamin K epoxide reductase family protein [Naasia sp.]
MTRTTGRQPISLAILFIVTGLAGLLAAFNLILDRFILTEDADARLSCDINPFVSCGTVIQSAQGEIFGFPNPMIGIMAFVAPVAVGVSLLAGARFASWYWGLFNVGLLGGIVFIHWLMTQSVYVIGALCPWCLLVWLVMIPLFWYGTVNNLARNFGLRGGAQRFFQKLLPFTWMIVLLNYLIIVLIIVQNFPLLIPYLFG